MSSQLKPKRRFNNWMDHNKVDFCITTYCQSKCPTCPRTDAGTLELADFITLQHMSLPVWKSVVDRVDWSDKMINFCGEHGDPMMHPQIEDFIMHACSVSWQCIINTNGGIRTPQWYQEIYEKVEDAEYGDLRFIFAIDGLTDETNSKYRINVDFDRAWSNMLACAEEHPRLTHWDFLVFEHNWHELEQVIETAAELDIALDVKINRGKYGLLTSKKGKEHVGRLLDIEVD